MFLNIFAKRIPVTVLALSVIIAVFIVSAPTHDVGAVVIKDYTACTDSDGGINVPTKGKVSILFTNGQATQTFTDYCINLETVREYYCSSQSASTPSYQDSSVTGYGDHAYCSDGGVKYWTN